VKGIHFLLIAAAVMASVDFGAKANEVSDSVAEGLALQ
jgi:hypothetical protein